MEKTYNELNYIQWLRDIKPKWTEEQILHSAGAKFGKDFSENTTIDNDCENDLFLVVNDEFINLSKSTVKELNKIITDCELDVDIKLKKAEKIEAIFAATENKEGK